MKIKNPWVAQRRLETILSARRMFEDGVPVSVIARELGITRETVYKYLKPETDLFIEELKKVVRGEEREYRFE